MASPPDAKILEDVEALGLIKPGYGVETLQVEFTRLFSVPGPDQILPYQSVYTDLIRLEPSGPGDLECGLSFAGGEFQGYLGGPCVSELKRWYAEAKFEPQNHTPAAPDHISIELAFLAHVCLLWVHAVEAKEMLDAKAWETLYEEFLLRFFGQWVPVFGKKLANNATSPFYVKVGRYLLDSISTE
ncbi:MAG: molecular chaperone TorD family protein [Gammaproteobacteria bacterium]|nr:molecular chaperone TorD family protein [Gammaproteobacteria bacterium]